MAKRETLILNALTLGWRELECWADVRELWDRRRQDGAIDALRWAEDYCPKGVEMARANVRRWFPEIAPLLDI